MHANKLYSVYCMYHRCPQHSGGQIENFRVEEITPGEVEAPHSPRTTVVTQQSLKGAGK